MEMSINFSDSEVILVFEGVEVRIQEDYAILMAKRILDYFSEDEVSIDEEE